MGWVDEWNLIFSLEYFVPMVNALDWFKLTVEEGARMGAWGTGFTGSSSCLRVWMCVERDRAASVAQSLVRMPVQDR